MSIHIKPARALTCISLLALAIFIGLNILVEHFHSEMQTAKAGTVEQKEVDRVNNLVATCETLKHFPDLMLVGSSVIGVPRLF